MPRRTARCRSVLTRQAQAAWPKHRVAKLQTYLAEGGFSQSLITKRKSSNQTAAIAAFGELQEL